MAVYTHLTEEKIQSVATAYGLGTLVDAKAIAEGVENSNYLIRTRQESEVRKSILTIYEKRVNIDDLPFFLGIMEHLHQGGVNCPLPLHTREGHQVIDVDSKKAAIVTFLEGGSASVIRNGHIRSLGASLAGMHLAAEGYHLARLNALDYQGWCALNKKIGLKANAVKNGLADTIASELDWLNAHWPKTLPTGVIHADLFPDNVFFIGEEVSGIIDFYFACNDAFLYDVAIVMNAWCFEQQREFNITKAGVLLSAYDRIRSIGKDELAALPVLCRGAALRFLLTRLHDWVFPQAGALVTPKDPLEYLKKLEFHQQVTHPAAYGITV